MLGKPIRIVSSDTTNWLVSALALLTLMVVGKPLLLPLAFALLLWAVLNAIVETLVGFRVPRWLGWTGSIGLLLAGLYLMTTVVANEATGIAAEAPGMALKLQQIMASLIAPLHMAVRVEDFYSRADVANFLANAAASVGASLLAIVQVLIYVGFLLAEQNNLVLKIAKLQRDETRRSETMGLVHAVARQVQSYLGVCTIMSAIMALAGYALLMALGVEFAGFWALVLFILTYIPTVGAVGVAFPALTALVQFGTLDALFIVAVLGTLHFVLMNIAQPAILGHSLNLSPFIIILSLTFWGLVWGVGGLFVAVPVTGAIAISCGHVRGLRWVTTLLAAPPPNERGMRRSKTGAEFADAEARLEANLPPPHLGNGPL